MDAKWNFGRHEWIADRLSNNSVARWTSLRTIIVRPGTDSELIGPGIKSSPQCFHATLWPGRRTYRKFLCASAKTPITVHR